MSQQRRSLCDGKEMAAVLSCVRCDQRSILAGSDHNAIPMLLTSVQVLVNIGSSITNPHPAHNIICTIWWFGANAMRGLLPQLGLPIAFLTGVGSVSALTLSALTLRTLLADIGRTWYC
jgi:hypothetical protein